jgi:hypothetical protein
VRKARGEKFRFGHAVWKAFLAGTFLCIPIWLFKMCGLCGGSKKKNTAYRKVEGDQQSSHNGGWYGAQPNTQYTAAPQGRTQAGKFEPMTYTSPVGYQQTPPPPPQGGYYPPPPNGQVMYVQPPVSYPGTAPIPTPSPSAQNAYPTPPSYAGSNPGVPQYGKPATQQGTSATYIPSGQQTYPAPSGY